MFYRLKSKLKLLAMFVCLALVFPAPALGAESTDSQSSTTALQLSMDDAVARALASSIELKSSAYTIEQNEENRDTAADNVEYTPADGDNAEASSAFISLIQSDLNWQMSKKNDAIKRDTIAKDVFQKYTDLLAAQEKVKLEERNLELSAFKRLAARMGYQVKSVSLSGKNAAERDYTAQESTLAQSRADLDSSYQEFNSLVGLNAQERPVLTDEPQYEAVEITDLEAEITRRIDSSPDIWLAERDVEKAQLSLDLYSYNSGQSSYRSKELDVDKAELSLADTKEQARQSLRSTYNSIVQSEQQYNTRQQDLQTAEENLQVAQIKYDLGMISKGDLLQAEITLTSARQSIKSLIYEHELLKMSFDKPWA